MALIPDDPTQRNALIGILGILAAAYFFNDLWLSGQKEEIVEMETRLEQLEDQNRRAQIIAARGGDLEERLAVYERHVQKLEELIPQREEVSALLNSITQQARASRVELANLRPEAPEPGNFYTRQTYELTAYGEYHDVGRFLTAIASLRRIITPMDLELRPFSGANLPVQFNNPVEAHFRIQTYVIPSNGVGGGQEGGGST